MKFKQLEYIFNMNLNQSNSYLLDLAKLFTKIGDMTWYIIAAVSTILMVYIFLKYRKCKYDKILLITLNIFYLVIAFTAFATIFYNLNIKDNTLRFIFATVSNSLGGLRMILVSYFIFELQRIKIFLSLESSE